MPYNKKERPLNKEKTKESTFKKQMLHKDKKQKIHHEDAFPF